MIVVLTGSVVVKVGLVLQHHDSSRRRDRDRIFALLYSLDILSLGLGLDYCLLLDILYRVVVLKSLRVVILSWRLFSRLLLLEVLEEVELVSCPDRLALGAVLASASAP